MSDICSTSQLRSATTNFGVDYKELIHFDFFYFGFFLYYKLK